MSNSVAAALELLKPYLERFSSLTHLDRVVLARLAQEPHGLSKAAAPSQLASLTHHTQQECSLSLTTLGTERIIRSEADRFYVDFDFLGVPSEHRVAIVRDVPAFQNLGAPSSEKALQSLTSLLEETPSRIYLALEVTSPKVFAALRHRAGLGRETYFLAPRRRDLPSQRHQHFDEVLREWKELLHHQLGARARKVVRFSLTSRPFPELYTSALVVGENARVDVYTYSAGTTRSGEILEVKPGTSLYDLIQHRYAQARRRAVPLASVWPGAWILRRLRLAATSLLALAVATTSLLTDNIVFAAVGAVCIGVLSNVLYSWFRVPE